VRLRQAAQAVLDAQDAYRDALNGGGHDGPHDTALHIDPCTDLPGVEHIYDLTGDCSKCGGAQYGTEDDLAGAYGDLREALGQPRLTWERR
jgi:hypothetical protein